MIESVPIFASVVVGKPVNGTSLTIEKEMQQCPKSDLARKRVVATNKGPKHRVDPDSKKKTTAIKALVKLRVAGIHSMLCTFVRGD